MLPYTCALCSKSIKDLLLHLRMEHDIRDVSQYESELAKLEAANRKRADFGKFVDELKEQVQKGLISPEEYRRRIKWWSDMHEDT